MSGFRCYCNRWSSNATYSNDNLGVKACLQDLCNKFLTDTAYHGWSLDTSIHTSNNEAILLTPSYSVYAMFFKHNSGSRLMIALNYNGLSTYNPGTRTKSTVDAMWYKRANWIRSYYGSSTYTMICMHGGLMGSYIPKSNTDQQDVFNPSADMDSADFFPSTASYVACTSPSAVPAVSSEGGYTCAPYSSSLIRQGTTLTNYTSSSFGVPDSYKRCYCIMADNKENFILCSQGCGISDTQSSIRWCTLGKLKSEESASNIAYAMPQSYYNMSVSRSSFYSGHGAINTDCVTSIGTANDSYQQAYFSTAPATNSGYAYTGCLMDAAGYYMYTQPFPIGIKRGKTVNEEYFHSLLPIAIGGGESTVRAWLDYDSLRTMAHRADIPAGTFLEDKQWLIIGYMWSFFGWANISSTSYGYTSDNTNTRRDFLVAKLDEGNTDSPFGW